MSCSRFTFLLTFLILAAAPRPSAAARLKALGDDGRLRGAFASFEGHASLLSDVSDSAILAGTFGYGARGGYRWAGWGVFLHAEQNLWVATEQESEVVRGAWNLGLGGELSYAEGFFRTSLVLGTSILAFDTLLDKAGTAGLFIDLRPGGFRWTVHEHLVLGLDPITFSLVAPVLGGIPLVYAQYRTVLSFEGLF